MLTRHVATVAAIAALLGPVSLAQAQSDNERQEMLRGGSTKKGIYNIFGLAAPASAAPPYAMKVNMRLAPSSSIRQSGGSERTGANPLPAMGRRKCVHNLLPGSQFGAENDQHTECRDGEDVPQRNQTYQ